MNNYKNIFSNKSFVLFLFLSLLSIISSAQIIQPEPYVAPQTQTMAGAKALFLELGGNGIIYSINYEHRLQAVGNGLGLRIGIGYADSKFNSGRRRTTALSFITIPAEVNILLGNNGKYFELGMGATYFSGNLNIGGVLLQDNLIGTMVIGYRKQPLKSGLLFKIAMTPIYTKSVGFMPLFFGLSIGYSFKQFSTGT